MEWNDIWNQKEDKFIEDVKKEFKDYEKEISEFISKHNLDEDNWDDYGYRYLFGDLKESCGEQINYLIDDITGDFDDDDYDEMMDSGCISDMEGTCLSEWMNLYDEMMKSDIPKQENDVTEEEEKRKEEIRKEETKNQMSSWFDRINSGQEDDSDSEK